MQLHLLIPGDINTLTGGYIYNKRMVNGLLEMGHNVQVYSLAVDFPFPSPESTQQFVNIINAIPKCETIIIDSLAFGAIPELLRKIKPNHPIVALIHMPLSIRNEFTAAQRKRLSIREKEAFSYADLILVTSPFTMNLLKGMGIDPVNIIVVLPGVEVLSHKNKYALFPRKLITVSNFTRNKGHLLLVDALKELKYLNWTLDCYGNTNFDPEYVDTLSRLIDFNNLTDRIFLHAPITGNDLSQVYVNSDLLIHPSEFETYGMVLTEAMAHGIPVIASAGGAITQTVPASIGVFFKENDTYSLQQTIKDLLLNLNKYHNLCKQASNYINQAQAWEKSIKEFEKALKIINE